MINFNIILASLPEFCDCYVQVPMRATYPANLILLDFNTLNNIW